MKFKTQRSIRGENRTSECLQFTVLHVVLSALSTFSGRGENKQLRRWDCDQITYYAAIPSFTHINHKKMSGHSTSRWIHAPRIGATGKQNNSKLKSFKRVPMICF